MSENHYSRTTPRHQRRTASELSNANRSRGFRDVVKHSAERWKNERTIQKYSSTTGSLALSLALLKSQNCQLIPPSVVSHKQLELFSQVRIRRSCRFPQSKRTKMHKE